MKALILRFGPALVIMATIFAASATPGSELPSLGNWIWDLLVKKGGHMIGYALLATAYYHAFTNNRNTANIYYFFAFCLTVLYAATDEWHQKFTPGRNSCIQDVGIDAIGGLIGLAVLSLIRLRFLTPDKSHITKH
jgi:VanZ family protein